MVNTTPRTHLKLIYNNIGRGGRGEWDYGDFSNILGGGKKMGAFKLIFATIVGVLNRVTRFKLISNQ